MLQRAMSSLESFFLVKTICLDHYTGPGLESFLGAMYTRDSARRGIETSPMPASDYCENEPRLIERCLSFPPKRLLFLR